MGNTIIVMNAPAKRNSMLPIQSPPPPSASRTGEGGRTNPNDSLTMLTVQALGGS